MRADYCPIGGEPCQSLCTEPCSVRKSVDSALVAQLVEALEKITQVDAGSPVKTYQEMEDIAKAALAAAREAGL